MTSHQDNPPRPDAGAPTDARAGTPTDARDPSAAPTRAPRPGGDRPPVDPQSKPRRNDRKFGDKPSPKFRRDNAGGERPAGSRPGKAESSGKTELPPREVSEPFFGAAWPERRPEPRPAPNRYAPRPALGRNKAAAAPERQPQRKGRQPFEGKSHLYEVIKVRLARSQRLIEVNTNETPFFPGRQVLVRIHRNVLLATTVGSRYRRVAEINSLPFILREASDEDLRIDESNRAIEKRAQELATAFAISNSLQMKVLSADLSHDHKNITINFASDVRVDFREMVAYLANQLKLRVEMYQLGLRNGTGLICALGSCGQRLCCGRFLGQFDPVAVKLLRAQGLATNPKRISGVCGRLYCCLSYEYCDYLKERRALPKKGKRIVTRWGLGRITDTDLIREEVLITYDNGETQRLTSSDYVPATDELIEKIEKEELTFPLEPARFFLNHDPSNAVELPLHTKAPVQPSPRSAGRRPVVPQHRTAIEKTRTAVPAQPAVRHEKPAVHPGKRHRNVKQLPAEYTTNAAGLVVRRKPPSDRPVPDAPAQPSASRTDAPAQPSASRTDAGADSRQVRRTQPRTHEKTPAPHDPPAPYVVAPPPQTGQTRPLPRDASHPENPRRRRTTRPKMTPPD